MTLVHYSRLMFYPGGGVASGAHVAIRLDNSNVVPLMFTDASASTPLTSPLTADSGGNIDFWAASGMYIAELAGDDFEVDIDPSFTDPVWPNLCTYVQAVPALVWTVDHYFGVPPMVQVLVASQEVKADVTHPSDTTTVISFGTPVAGIVQLRR